MSLNEEAHPNAFILHAEHQCAALQLLCEISYNFGFLCLVNSSCCLNTKYLQLMATRRSYYLVFVKTWNIEILQDCMYNSQLLAGAGVCCIGTRTLVPVNHVNNTGHERTTEAREVYARLPSTASGTRKAFT